MLRRSRLRAVLRKGTVHLPRLVRGVATKVSNVHSRLISRQSEMSSSYSDRRTRSDSNLPRILRVDIALGWVSVLTAKITRHVARVRISMPTEGLAGIASAGVAGWRGWVPPDSREL